jgi:hypothetical protein
MIQRRIKNVMERQEIPKEEATVHSESMARRDGGLPSNDGGTSGIKGANVEGRGIRSNTSNGPYGIGHSEIFGNNKEAAQGPTYGCRAECEAKETDPWRLWILGDIGCRLQEGVLLCSGGMA